MALASTASHLSRTDPSVVAGSQSSRYFYVGLAAISDMTVLIAFANSVSLRLAGGVPLSSLVLFHGGIFGAWVVLFIAQTVLAASGRLRVHRLLGVIGAGLAALMLVVGYFTSIVAARRGYNPAGIFPDAIGFLTIPLGDLVVFGSFITLAVLYRRHAKTQKRFMVLALVGGLVPASFTRLPFIGGHALAITVVTILFLVAGPLYDLRSRARIHRVYAWGAPVAFLSWPLRIAVGYTDTWRSFATWLIS